MLKSKRISHGLLRCYVLYVCVSHGVTMGPQLFEVVYGTIYYIMVELQKCCIFTRRGALALRLSYTKTLAKELHGELYTTKPQNHSAP